MSSVLIGQGAEILLSEGGVVDRELFLDRNVPNLRSVDFNDEAEQLTVFACSPGGGEVSVRKDVNLTGECRVLPEGMYSRTGQGAFGRLDLNGISSIEVGSAASACLCVIEFVDLTGSTLRTGTHVTATVVDLTVTEVGNDRASFVGIGLNAEEYAAYDAAGDLEVGEENPTKRWRAVTVVNCQLSKEPLFAWTVVEGGSSFSAAGARDTAFASIDNPSECAATDGGLSIDLKDGANLVRLVDPVACGAFVDPGGQDT